MLRKSIAVSLFAGIVLALGCSSEDKLYDVSGTITFEGNPIPKGLIFFDPDTSKGTKGTQGFANIENGKFDTSITGKGKGIRGGGTYLIRISGFDGKVGPEAPFGQFLFPEFEMQKELPAQNQTFDHDVKRKK